MKHSCNAGVGWGGGQAHTWLEEEVEIKGGGREEKLFPEFPQQLLLAEALKDIDKWRYGLILCTKSLARCY